MAAFNTIRIGAILAGAHALGQYELSGWVKTHRRSKNVSFIELTDGSSVRGLQLVLEPDLATYLPVADGISTGAAIRVRGELVDSPAKGQRFEFQVSEIELIGAADPESYPLQKKGHTLEFLREVLHLRPRSNTLGAVFRIRSVLSMAVHEFFQGRGFLYLSAPIITTADCEGAGEMFKVTTLDLGSIPISNGQVDYSGDFFGEAANLTVSGQLEGEAFAQAFRDIYTFGPTFRAENSNTTRHLAEFWMIEPEMAFCDLALDMQIAEEFVKHLLQTVLEKCGPDLDFLQEREWVDNDQRAVLEHVAVADYEVLEYGDAIRILQASGQKFDFYPEWGCDLQTEHERYLTERHVKKPVFVINYPKEIKAFYMRMNEDGKTVRAMDLLVPRLGEIIGGSQREDRLDVLQEKIQSQNMSPDQLWWYLDLRRYGSTPHAGFGLGFERLIMYVTGMQNIRDVIPFPRHPGFAKF